VFPQNIIKGEKKSAMNVHFIDVGQGDSILIQTPSNKTILIDGGSPKAGKKVVAYLEKLHIERLDLLIATHPDIDHIGGLSHVMKSIDIDQIIDSGKFYTTKTYMQYINQVKQAKIPMTIAKKDDNIKIDPTINIKVLNAHERRKNNNQSSIVLKVNYGEIDFLLMADVEQKQEKELLKQYDLEADVVKIAHHGSKTSSSLDFLQAVNPKIALITYSKKNKYGHPVQHVIQNLNQIRATIYSTAVYGDIILSTDGKSIFILPEKNPIDGILEAS
jgi:beta-lactamase superfamily II metal-dependent hydrolase